MRGVRSQVYQELNQSRPIQSAVQTSKNPRRKFIVVPAPMYEKDMVPTTMVQNVGIQTTEVQGLLTERTEAAELDNSYQNQGTQCDQDDSQKLDLSRNKQLNYQNAKSKRPSVQKHRLESLFFTVNSRNMQKPEIAKSRPKLVVPSVRTVLHQKNINVTLPRVCDTGKRRSARQPVPKLVVNQVDAYKVVHIDIGPWDLQQDEYTHYEQEDIIGTVGTDAE